MKTVYLTPETFLQDGKRAEINLLDVLKEMDRFFYYHYAKAAKTISIEENSSHEVKCPQDLLKLAASLKKTAEEKTKKNRERGKKKIPLLSDEEVITVSINGSEVSVRGMLSRVVDFGDDPSDYVGIASKLESIKKDFVLSDIDLAVIFFERLYGHKIDGKHGAFLGFFDRLAVLLFVVEASRCPVSFFSAVIALDLVFYGKYTFSDLFASRNNYSWDDIEGRNFGGKYPMAVNSTGSSNIQDMLTIINSRDSSIIADTLIKRQHHAVLHRILTLIYHWIDVNFWAISKNLPRDKDSVQEGGSAAVYQKFHERFLLFLQQKEFVAKETQKVERPKRELTQPMDYCVIFTHCLESPEKRFFSGAGIFHNPNRDCKLVSDYVRNGSKKITAPALIDVFKNIDGQEYRRVPLFALLDDKITPPSQLFTKRFLKKMQESLEAIMSGKNSFMEEFCQEAVAHIQDEKDFFSRYRDSMGRPFYEKLESNSFAKLNADIDKKEQGVMKQLFEHYLNCFYFIPSPSLSKKMLNALNYILVDLGSIAGKENELIVEEKDGMMFRYITYTFFERNNSGKIKRLQGDGWTVNSSLSVYPIHYANYHGLTSCNYCYSDNIKKSLPPLVADIEKCENGKRELHTVPPKCGKNDISSLVCYSNLRNVIKQEEHCVKCFPNLRKS